MTGLHKGEGQHKIHPTQVVWQVGEVLMNAWILYAIVTAGITLPLIVWTVFEVGMNGWILVTMVKVGISKRTAKEQISEEVETALPRLYGGIHNRAGREHHGSKD